MKNMSVLTWSARYFCQIAVNLQVFRQIFEKYWNTKFYENPSSGACGWTVGRTGRQDKANGRFSQFANAPTNKQVLSSTVREQTWL
jgi:hypothetical protein